MTLDFSQIAGVIVVALFLATINKVLLDLVAQPILRKFPRLDPSVFNYVALITGLLLAWAFNVNLLVMLANGEPARIAGLILTGLVIGAGADTINDLFAGVQGRAAYVEPLPAVDGEEAVSYHEWQPVRPRVRGW